MAAQEPAGAGSSWGAIPPALLLLGPLLIAIPSRRTTATARYVVVGVRSDAPPFSSVVRIGEKETYAGYLIGLCQQIFAPHPDGHEQYRMVTSEVTVYDRFERLRRDPRVQWRPGQPLAGAKVDLLCDPVTLRYSMEDKRTARRPTDRRDILADGLRDRRHLSGAKQGRNGPRGPRLRRQHDRPQGRAPGLRA